MAREWHLRRSSATRGGLLSGRATPAQFANLFLTALSLLPLSVLCAGGIVLLATLLLSTAPPAPVFEADLNLSDFTETAVADSPPLPKLLAIVADALEAENVTFWLLPGLGLHPASASAPAAALGRLSPWQEGVDMGTADGSTMAVIRATTRLHAEHDIVVTESFFGLRLFHAAGSLDDRFDFRTPFVDLVQFRQKAGSLVAPCCDCAPLVVGACTKKLCDCLACVLAADDVFPQRHVVIEEVRRRLPSVRRTESLMLPGDLPGIHPLATQGVIPRPANVR